MAQPLLHQVQPGCRPRRGKPCGSRLGRGVGAASMTACTAHPPVMRTQGRRRTPPCPSRAGPAARLHAPAAPRAVLGVGRPRSDESGRVATPRAARRAHRPAGSALDAGKQLHLPARSPQPSWRMWVMRSRSLMARWSSSGCSGSTCNPCRRIAGNSFPAGRRRSCAPVPFGDRRAVTAPSAGQAQLL